MSDKAKAELALTVNKNAFEVGDLVTLKSGGPVMTAIARDGAHYITAWFIPTGQVLNGKFPKEALAPFVSYKADPAKDPVGLGDIEP